MNLVEMIEDYNKYDSNLGDMEGIICNQVRRNLEAILTPIQKESTEILRPVDYDDTRLDTLQKERIRYLEGQIEGIHKAAEALGIELYSEPNV